MKNQGFTLVETLVYLALATVILSALISFGFLLMNLNTKGLVIAEVNTNAREALKIIADKIKIADVIT
jgi:Tfp pilus assembly protein PilW